MMTREPSTNSHTVSVTGLVIVIVIVIVSLDPSRQLSTLATFLS